jgi:SAM-dependent methyltransferase
MDHDARFTLRSCPYCGSSDRTPLFNLEAEQFCSVNWTYSKNYRELLDLPKFAVFPIYRCMNCGFVYARFVPSPEFLSAVYEKVILPEFKQGSENHASYARRMRYIADLIELAPRQSSLKALDFGCGLGVSLRVLNAARIEAVGFDSSSTRATYVADMGGSIAMNRSALECLAPFGILICDNILEHLPDPIETLRFLASLCVPEAVLYISVPDYEEEFIQKQLYALQRGFPVAMTLNPWEHLNYFNLPHLEQMLNRSGFEPLRFHELPGHVNIGLRPEANPLARYKNSLASGLRLIRYAVSRKPVQTVQHRFYRLRG